MQCKLVQDMDMLYGALVRRMEKDSSGWLKIFEEQDKTHNADPHTKFIKLISFINQTDENFVFFLDNVDLLPLQDLSNWSDWLLQNCHNAKVMTTGRTGEANITVAGLSHNKDAAWKLFA